MANQHKTNCIIDIRHFLFIAISILALLGSVAFGERPAQQLKGTSATALRMMARLYMAYGEYAKAEVLAERAFAIAEKDNLSDIERCLCLSDLAYLYCGEGKLEPALEKCRKSLSLQEKVYGENHPYSAYTLRILASIYQKQARYGQAEAALQRAMDIMLSTLCLVDSRAIAPFQIDLANLYVQQGKLEQAESYFIKALPAISDTFGAEHLYTANVLGSMARLYVLQGKYSQAELLIAQTVTIQEKIYGPNSSLVVSAWLTMADICWAKGDFAQAEKLIQKAVTSVERTGNFTELVVLQQRATEIRSAKAVAYSPVAKAFN